ncbi:hypothetical protein LNKW23_11100 [Paralimibaculum aggregatum]|uniref:FlgO domain-containing protein n=1 Tax=Paralimibaculum aggregatum TaxID=3036245 RepID=A0ABQ6LFY4_9RHOB|nr:hypothetical protein [Limibaculum sp. NKW23]GMG81897.1 hypothetical protein LNKW23_11100 [Limibaculum sp. NKW23]
MRAIWMAVLLAVGLGGVARAATLDDGMDQLAERIAPQLQEERNRAGVSRAVDLYLAGASDLVSGERCPALGTILMRRLAAAVQGRVSRTVAQVILRQEAKEGELAMRLEWSARRPGHLELHSSYGRLRGGTIVGTFIPHVEIAVASMSDREILCAFGYVGENYKIISVDPLQISQNLTPDEIEVC